MSVEAISHIMRTHIPDGVAKLVAMVLADYADPVSGRCWPKIPTLAIQCSQSERTVQRKLKVLEELDVLHVEPNTSGGRKGNVYVLHLRGAARRRPGPDDLNPKTSGSSTGDKIDLTRTDEEMTGDTQSPVRGQNQAAGVTPTGDNADTRRVTVRSPPKESTRESTNRIHSEPFGSGAGEPSPRQKLFSEGRPAVMALGVGQREAGAMIGRWLRDAGDDAGRVLVAIRQARDAAPHAPIPWITAHLKAGSAVPPSASTDQPRRSNHGALARLARRLGDRHDARHAVPGTSDLGPVIDHEADGPAHGAVVERAGRASRGLSPPQDRRVTGTDS